MERLTIDGRKVEVHGEVNVLDAARSNGIYIPTLCSHPDLSSLSEIRPAERVYRGNGLIADDPEPGKPLTCGLCLIEIEGRDQPVLACETTVLDGMKVVTRSEIIDRLRRKNLGAILERHPRACLVCGQSEGCDRLDCSLGVPEEERCCSEFSRCEFRQVAQYVGINRDIPPYVPGKRASIEGGKLFKFDFNLCIACLRCVRACRNLQGSVALGFVRREGQVAVGTSQPGLAKSGCTFCGACVRVCPTGAMVATSEKCGADLTISPPVLPREPFLEFNEESVETVPETPGIIHLLDDRENVIFIVGSANMRLELMGCLKTAGDARYFLFKEEDQFTQRQNELIQHFMETHGGMPLLNAELDDLF